MNSANSAKSEKPTEGEADDEEEEEEERKEGGRTALGKS